MSPAFALAVWGLLLGPVSAKEPVDVSAPSEQERTAASVQQLMAAHGADPASTATVSIRRHFMRTLPTRPLVMSLRRRGGDAVPFPARMVTS